MCLFVPMTQVLLHAIIDDLKSDDDKIFNIEQMTDKRWWKKVNVWITIARVGVPLSYVLVALAIVVPGILNIYAETSNDET